MTDPTLMPALIALESTLQTLGVDLAAHAAPGATPSALEAAADALGFDLPPDVAIFYSWHNGGASLGEERARWNDLNVAPNLWLISLDEAMDSYRFQRQLAADIGFDPIDPSTRLLPIFQTNAAAEAVARWQIDDPEHCFSDCLYPEMELPTPEPLLPTIADLVRVLLDVLTSGEVYLDPSAGLRFTEGDRTPVRYQHLPFW